MLQLKNKEDFFKLNFWPDHDVYFSKHVEIACASLSMAFPKMTKSSTNSRCDVEGPSMTKSWVVKPKI